MNEYFKDNFLEYIKNHENVTSDGDKYYGIGKIKVIHQTEVDREARILTLMGGGK